MTVLLIDDDDFVRMLARISLTKAGGLDVIDAGSAAEGLLAAVQHQPDVILLDVMMPVTDGPATFAALSADPRTSGIPVIFLTAKAMPSEIDRLEKLGAVAVFTKPFDPLTLGDDIRRVLAARG